MDEKEYMHYTGYPGGQKVEIAKDLIKASSRSNC